MCKSLLMGNSVLSVSMYVCILYDVLIREFIYDNRHAPLSLDQIIFYFFPINCILFY